MLQKKNITITLGMEGKSLAMKVKKKKIATQFRFIPFELLKELQRPIHNRK